MDTSRKGTTRTVAAVAAAAGVNPQTVRYYERLGLLAAPPRTPGGYRVYDDDAAQRLRTIKASQRFGLRLSQIKRLLSRTDAAGDPPCDDIDATLRHRIDELSTEIDRLAGLRDDLVRVTKLHTDSHRTGRCSWKDCRYFTG